MGIGIGTVEVKKSRGEMVVQGLGQSPRGTKFVKDREELGVKSSADPQFKTKLAAAITKMFTESPPA